MTQQETFEAIALNSEIEYQGKRWFIKSTFDDDTADLAPVKGGDIINVPFAQLKLAKGVTSNA